MRLGVLEFGSMSWVAESVLDPLRAQDIDVIPGDSAIVSQGDVLREAKRLARADCDGVLLVVGDDGLLSENMSAAATLLAGVPLLLAGDRPGHTYFDAAGALEAIGARFDRVYTMGGEPNLVVHVQTWLGENGKKQRHRGLEAARKLYGQRLFVAPETGGLPDAALWMHQFGVITTTEPEGADFAAPDGDPCGSLTGHLLALVSGETITSRVPIVVFHGGAAEDGDLAVTFARITRTRGRFRCLLLRGALRPDRVTIAHFDCPDPQLFAAASSPWLHAVPGDYLGAMRAACEALDISTAVLRPAVE